ncbi:hypothetical protein BMS3Abin10_00036 [bacterium BMS3Abin10]|nr:hypothetical protein BMS3Abin10_00036 [bacterium BMS3Abin10]GBE37458.1 hypothetical protein BMS3Bbin08_00047 [bacterium BMS3Bbin08]HDH50441.1 DUF2933 domain-containing protein [Nitrospirota bacterium]HDK16328.1 DUF2933 domain-containing protein [Nitrospirota bacterium]HDZ88952.1 DUF2933 domain-containing protein [Nitrospirota bacterium]
MEWVRENWVWIILFAVFIGMHLFGHGGHGGHGGKEEDNEHKGHSGEGSSGKKGGSSCH